MRSTATTKEKTRRRVATRRTRKLEHTWKWKALSSLALFSLIVQTSAFGLFFTPIGAATARVEMALAPGSLPPPIAPDLALTKTIVPGSEKPTSIQYTISYENIADGNGDWPAYAVTVRDTIPAGLSNATILPAPNAFDGTTATWIVAPVLAAGASGSFTYTLLFDELGPDCRVLTNSAAIAQDLPTLAVTTATIPYPELNTTNNTSTATSTYFFGTCSPVLVLTKSDGVTSTTNGSTLTYTINWTVGNDDAPELVLTDVLPAGVTFLPPASGGGVYDNATRTVTWTYGPQAAGASGSETVTVSVDPAANGTITNNATVQAFQNGSAIDDPIPAHDTTSVEPVVVPPQQPTLLAPVLTVSKTANKTTALANDTVLYTIVIKNTGNGAAQNVGLHDTLPSGMVFTDTLMPDRTWTISPMFAPGETSTITYSATLSPDAAPGGYENVVTATADNHAPVVATASIAVTGPVVLGATTGTPLLMVTKTADQKTVFVGDTVTFTIVVKNGGSADATNVALADFLPEGLVFADDNTITKDWTIGTLAAGKSSSVAYETTVTDDAIAGTYTNVVDATYAEGGPIEATASVNIKQVKVLGAQTLAETGAGLSDTLTFLSGALLLFVAVIGYRKSAALA